MQVHDVNYREIRQTFCGSTWELTMQTSDLQVLFAYSKWANQRILDAAANLSKAQFTQTVFKSDADSIRDKMVHIFSAEWLWRMRCQDGISPPRMSLPR